MIDYKLLTFSCVPYSGEKWMIKAAQLAGFGPAFWHQAHSPFPDKRGVDEFRVTSVRNPFDWLWLAYQEHKLCRLNGYTGRISLLTADSFDKFVYRYLGETPGEITRLWKQYQADTCLRIEDQPRAFVELLEMLGVPDQFIQILQGMPRPPSVIVGPYRDSSLRQIVMQAEEEYCDALDYF